MDQFDRYQHWLGIDGSAGVPDHYRLLGLEPSQATPEAVQNAAAAALECVRKAGPGEYRQQWQDLIGEIVEAELCLRDPQQKQAYDRALRGDTGEVADDSQTRPAREDHRLSELAAEHRIASSAPVAKFAPIAGTGPAATSASGPSSPPAASNEPSSPSPQPGNPPSLAMYPPGAKVPQTPSSPTATPSPEVSQQNAVSQAAPAVGGPDPMAPVDIHASGPPAGWPATGHPPQSGTPGPWAGAAQHSNGGFPPAAPLQHPPAAATPQPGPGNPAAPTGQPLSGPAAMPAAVPAAIPVAQLAHSYPLPVASVVPVSGAPQGTPAPATATATATAMPAGSAPLGTSAEQPYVSPSAGSQYRARRRRQSSSSMLLGVGIAFAIVVIGAIFLLNQPATESVAEPNPGAKTSANSPTWPTKKESPSPNSPDNAERPAKRPTTTVESPKRNEEQMPAEQPDDPPGESQQPETMPIEGPPIPNTPAEPEPAVPEPTEAEPTEPEPVEATPAQSKAVHEALRSAIEALADNDRQAAAQAIEVASKEAGQVPELQQHVNAVRTLSEGVDGFWSAVRETAGGMRAGEEIVIGSTVRMLVVEASPDRLVVRSAGQNRTFLTKDMPLGLARNLANRWFEPTAPETSVCLGAVEFVSRTGSRERTRAYWKEALQAGYEAQPLLDLLDADFLSAEAE